MARSRGDNGEHNELRRVVNSLLLFIDHIQPKGFLIAATNLEQSLEPALASLDEVVWFDKPNRSMIARFLRLKFKNISTPSIPPSTRAGLEGYSYAEIERVCVQAIKSMIIDRRKQVQAHDFNHALKDEARRRAGNARLEPATKRASVARYDHLQLVRLPEQFERRKHGGGGPPPARDRVEHSRRLREELDTATASPAAAPQA